MTHNQYRGPHHRGPVITAVVLLAGALSGCGPGSTAAIPSAPTTSKPSTSAPSTSEPGPTLLPSTAPARDPDSTRPPSGKPVPTDRTLGDDGIGGLELGMSRRAALATGLVGPERKGASDTCEVHTGKGDIELVYLVDGRVSIIAVGPEIRMAKGIGVGDTYEELHAEYPEAVDGGPGRISVDAPGAKVPAYYRVGIDGDQAYPDSRILEIALQTEDHGCYE